MTTDTERLDQADACHDDDPARAAGLLRAIAPAKLPPERRTGYAFLLNHVLGEKLNHWDDALQSHRQLLAAAQPAPAAVLWRQAATAALLAGAGGVAGEWAQDFAQASGAVLERSTELLQLSAAMYQVPGLTAQRAGEQVLAALAPLAQPQWQAPNPLDSSVAACANNIASGLLDRPGADLQHAATRAALAQAAEQAQRFWQRAGSWVQHERALYLRAMAGNALGELQPARAHAQAALALLDAHDSAHAEDVDRAFIELERRHACERLGLAGEAADAAHKTKALAARFDDAELTRWFARREQALAAL